MTEAVSKRLRRAWARRAVTLNLKASDLLIEMEAMLGEDDELVSVVGGVSAATHELANLLEGWADE